ncbi:MAG: 8-amino-7-oxononanoate synthase [Acidobacteria bacterium]|nr:8-amino-7-oxononanoate synthase [Acidobacteriota bacterium]
MNSGLQGRVEARLRALADGGLCRSLRPPSGIDLSSNDYLGLAGHPLLRHNMIEAIQQDGCGSTGSRLLRGHRASFDTVEQAFAVWKGTERALYFSSGYLANLAVLTTFAEPGDVILGDRLNHASLREGVRLSFARRVVFRHNDVHSLERLLASTRGRGQVFVVTESLFSMDGDIPPLGEYGRLCREAGALLVVDEAHAVGVYGASGSGLIEDAGIARDVFVSINTAGKALGVAGAFVAGPAWAIEYLVQRARPFVFSTAPPPALAAALTTSMALVAAEPERRMRLRDRATRLRRCLAAAGIAIPAGSSQIIPVLIGEATRTVAVAEALQSAGFDVRAIRPPTVAAGTARLRLSAKADLSDAVMDQFIDALAAALEESKCYAGSS